MNIPVQRVLDCLAVEEPCIGAVFESYTFDADFFEHHVLRAVLRLTSGPVEQPDRYHSEAIKAIQETPIVAIVDAGVRQGGRSLPYDLLDMSECVFHAKSALLLYKPKARLMIGSGNLTFSGYSTNAELFTVLDLSYDDPGAAALLAAYEGHLDRVAKLIRQPGSQLPLLRKELRARLVKKRPQVLRKSNNKSRSIELVDSTVNAILEQLKTLLPPDAEITRIGLLAPFFEKDDAEELDIDSVLGALLSRANEQTALDIGLAWSNVQVAPSLNEKLSSLEEGLGRLWTWIHQDQEGERTIEHLIPISISQNTLAIVDQRGRRRRRRISEANGALDQRIFWTQPQPKIFAPRRTFESARKICSDFRTWLFPGVQFVDGVPTFRPLHAKLLTIAYRYKKTWKTQVLMGSANMSRRALLLSTRRQRKPNDNKEQLSDHDWPKRGGNGNVELGLVFRLKGAYSIIDFAPDMVCAPYSLLDVNEPGFPPVGPNYALAISKAEYNPVTRTLEIVWSASATSLPPWVLKYEHDNLARSKRAPTEPLLVEEFVLRPQSAEVILCVKDKSYPVPILVTGLIALPAAPGIKLGLNELLLFLGRRIGAERAIDIAKVRTRRTGDSDHPDQNDPLTTFFGEGLSQADVFRAWWAAAENLHDPNASLSAFRIQLEGAMGIAAAWQCMRDSMQGHGPLSQTEVWFFGAELLRTLEKEIDLSGVIDFREKQKLLRKFKTRILNDLNQIGYDGADSQWVRRIQSFYGAVAG